MPPLPTPVRAALGLAALMLDEARHLPDRAIEVPMRAVSRALALSLRAQQRYAALAARGDDVLSARSTTDDPPAWATFDDAATDDTATDDAATDAVDLSDVDLSKADASVDDPVPLRPVRPRPNKTVRAPRSRPASAFDAVSDDDESSDGGDFSHDTD